MNLRLRPVHKSSEPTYVAVTKIVRDNRVSARTETDVFEEREYLGQNVVRCLARCGPRFDARPVVGISHWKPLARIHQSDIVPGTIWSMARAF